MCRHQRKPRLFSSSPPPIHLFVSFIVQSTVVSANFSATVTCSRSNWQSIIFPSSFPLKTVYIFIVQINPCQTLGLSMNKTIIFLTTFVRTLVTTPDYRTVGLPWISRESFVCKQTERQNYQFGGVEWFSRPATRNGVVRRTRVVKHKSSDLLVKLPMRFSPRLNVCHGETRRRIRMSAIKKTHGENTLPRTRIVID